MVHSKKENKLRTVVPSPGCSLESPGEVFKHTDSLTLPQIMTSEALPAAPASFCFYTSDVCHMPPAIYHQTRVGGKCSAMLKEL